MLKYNSIKPERLVGVLRPDQQRGAVPAWFISKSEAQYLLDCSLATWNGRWTLKLNEPKALQLRGQSCNIKERTILAALNGSEYHRSLIEAWA